MCGYRDAKRRFPVGETGLCDVFSCTKIMTMVAAMQLVEQGKLRLDDEVTAYLPEFGSVRAADAFYMPQRPVSWPDDSRPSHPARSKMRVIDLMTMTSGMTYQLDAAPIQQAVKASGSQADARNGAHDLARRIREAVYLQPLSHDVVAIVEIVSGERYADYLTSHMACPLRLSQMMMHVPREAEDRRAAQYMCDFQTGKVSLTTRENRFRLTSNYDSGGAGLTRTADDYCAVLDAAVLAPTVIRF